MNIAAGTRKRKSGVLLCVLTVLLLCPPCFAEDRSLFEQDLSGLHNPFAMNLAAVSGTEGTFQVSPIHSGQPAAGSFVRTVEVRSFYKGYLIPRLERHLGQVGVLHTSQLDGQELHTWASNDSLVRETERQFEKGASRALRTYLTELCGLDVRIDNFSDRNRIGTGGNGASEHQPRKIHFGLGVSHALPRVDVRYELGNSRDVRLTVAGSGKIDLHYGSYRGGNRGHTRIFAGYDIHQSRSNFGLRLSY